MTFGSGQSHRQKRIDLGRRIVGGVLVTGGGWVGGGGGSSRASRALSPKGASWPRSCGEACPSPAAGRLAALYNHLVEVPLQSPHPTWKHGAQKTWVICEFLGVWSESE